MMMDKIKKLRTIHLKTRHNTEFYPYQELISDRIIEALIQNLSITKEATEEEILKLEPIEVFAEFSRQCGKTTAVVLTIDFVMVYFPRIFKRRIEIGIFAPQREQAKTDFDRLKEALLRDGPLVLTTEADEQMFREQSNATTLVLPNGASCYIFPVSPTTKPESKSLNLIVFEESQYLQDQIIKQQIWPMGANTNAPRVYLGTAGTQICYFYREGQANSAIKLYYDEIVKQRREVYKSSGDATHLIYEQTVKKEIEKYGKDSDEIARPYFGKWLIGGGQFVTQENLERLETERGLTHHYKEEDCFVGIDTAKHPDSTVVTVIKGYNPTSEDPTNRKSLINWLELKGENYKDQFDIIVDFVSRYRVKAIAIDSTGQGEFMPDWFATTTQWRDERSGLYRVKFSSLSKDLMYKNLKVVIQELLTDLPKLSTGIRERFKQQMLDLQQEWNGELLRVKHPDDPNAHDDYPDSWALAEWAYAQWQQTPTPQVTVVSVGNAKERKVHKQDDKVSDYWPGD